MDIWFHPARELDAVVRAAALRTPGFDADFQPEIRAADPRHADFQANGVLGYAKARKQNPRALGATLAEALKNDPALDTRLVHVEVAGPGFINFKFTPAFLVEWLKRYRNEVDFRSAADKFKAWQHIVIDYPSPNVAKQMHIGHLRPMVIGEAISRLLEFCGAHIIRDNHIGDWGSNFGILIRALKDANDVSNGVLCYSGGIETVLPLLENRYKEGAAKAVEKNSAWAESARQELVKLQNGDPENLSIWRDIVKASERAAHVLYDLLGVTIQYTLGESFYRDKVESVYEELVGYGLAQISEGALVVFHPEHPRFNEQPFIIRKSDGASNYASTDLATVLYRVQNPEWRANEIIYVTDGRQRDHFEQLFLTVNKWFNLSSRPIPRLRHVWFGTILGEDGKAIKTKSGGSLKLIEVLSEAISRAQVIVNEKNSGLTEAERSNIARVVGLGAVKYADLRQDRTSDYEFAWDKLLALDGNTAPYLLYAIARIHSIFRKMNLSPDSSILDDYLDEANFDESNVSTEQLTLARKLIQFPIILEAAISELKPHYLATYLYELAQDFSGFYNQKGENNRIYVEVFQPGTRHLAAWRIMLAARTLRILETGLHTLGLETLERM